MRFLLTLAGVVSVYAICTSAYAISRADVEFVDAGDNREAVHARLGTGQTDMSGLKETYALSDGSKWVAQYYGGVLVRGYVVDR